MKISGFLLILSISKEKEHLLRPECADCALLRALIPFQNADLDVPKHEKLKNLNKTKPPNIL